MQNQQHRWDQKYANRGSNLSQPEDFLVQRKHLLCPRTVLDVACGDGRHSIYLARSGFAVTGIDFSEQGLKRLETFSANESLGVKTYHRNLDAKQALADLDPFDNIIVIHFKPQSHTFDELASALRSGGILLMTSFNARQHEQKGFPKEFCYADGEYVDVGGALELMEYVSYEDERGYFDGYVFRKR